MTQNIMPKIQDAPDLLVNTKRTPLFLSGENEGDRALDLNKEFNIFELPVFADANIWSMWPAEKLSELAEDIKENGFDHRYPITVANVEGVMMLLDGRNRREAAKIAGVIPPAIITDIDPKLAVHRSNNQNRDATPGQKAMATAMAFPDNTEKGGRGKKAKTVDLINGFDKSLLSRARYVLRNNPIAEGQSFPQRCIDIMSGSLSLTEAYELTQADVKRSEEEKAIRDANAKKLLDVRNRYPDLAALVDDERITLLDAIASAERRDIDAAAKKKRDEEEEANKLAEAERKIREEERLKKEDFDRTQSGKHQYLDQLINATCVAVNKTQVDILKNHLNWDVFATKYRHKRADAIRVLTALHENLPALLEILESAK